MLLAVILLYQITFATEVLNLSCSLLEFSSEFLQPF